MADSCSSRKDYGSAMKQFQRKSHNFSLWLGKLCHLKNGKNSLQGTDRQTDRQTDKTTIHSLCMGTEGNNRIQ